MKAVVAERMAGVVLVAQIVGARLDAVINHGSHSAYGDVLREVRRRGGATYFLAVNSGAAQLVRALGKDARGLIFTQVVPYPWSRSTALAREHQQATQKYDPEAALSFSSIEGASSSSLLRLALTLRGPAKFDPVPLFLSLVSFTTCCRPP